jgi:hypothetical protein
MNVGTLQQQPFSTELGKVVSTSKARDSEYIQIRCYELEPTNTESDQMKRHREKQDSFL